MREKYNQYSFNYIKKLIQIGKKLAEDYNSFDDVMYATDYNMEELKFIAMGFKNPDFIPEIGTFYRIGEPRQDGYAAYKSSWNFSEDRAEDGVSVVTTAWLNSMKSVFFNTTDEKIKSAGVYKIMGFALPSVGGDDETIICPLDWAIKTKIRTRNGLKKAVRL